MLEDEVREYEEYLKAVVEAQGGKFHSGLASAYVNAFRKRLERERTVLGRWAKKIPYSKPERITDPLWQVLFNSSLGSPFLAFVAYLAITKGSIRGAREHFGVNRFTLWEWMDAERSNARRSQRSDPRTRPAKSR